MNISSEQISEDVVALLRKLKSALDKIGEERSITRIQLSALYGISQTDGLPMGRAADVLHCDPSNVTGIVDRLVNQGLIIRQECATDRRAKILYLTEKGKAEVAYLRKTLPLRLDCDCLTIDERSNLHQLIQKILTCQASDV